MYDACLRFDADPDPLVIDDFLPLNMPYGVYRDALTGQPDLHRIEDIHITFPR